MNCIDRWLLRKTQLLSDWIHAWTGVDCFRQARFCYAVTAVLVIIEVAYVLRERGRFTFGCAIGCAAVAVWLYRALFPDAVETMFEAIPEDRLFANPRGKLFERKLVPMEARP
jgi:hypothetical protein